MTTATGKPRRTQAERSATTRALLLDATISSLVDVGYANTTTTGIAERAGVSRGAQMHHFSTKADLVASAVEHLADKRMALARAQLEKPSADRDRVRSALDLLWGTHNGPLFTATLELWIVARTDDELREKLQPVEHRVLSSLFALARELFGEEIASRRGFEHALDASVAAMQGLALAETHQIRRPRVDQIWRGCRDELARLFED